MVLLILKSGEKYIRLKDGRYLLVGLEKASVFPLDKMDVVRRHESRLNKEGFMNICVKKIVLTEEDI